MPNTSHLLWLAAGLALGYLVLPMLLSAIGGKKG